MLEFLLPLWSLQRLRSGKAVLEVTLGRGARTVDQNIALREISAQPHTLIMHADILIMYAFHCF